jgi:hypothetical protein
MGQMKYTDSELLESFSLEENEKKCCQGGCTCDKEKECEKFFLTGCSGELFLDDSINNYQEIKLIEPTCGECDSHVALTLSSVDRNGKHDILNRFKNKHIKITIEVV